MSEEHFCEGEPCDNCQRCVSCPVCLSTYFCESDCEEQAEEMALWYSRKSTG